MLSRKFSSKLVLWLLLAAFIMPAAFEPFTPPAEAQQSSGAYPGAATAPFIGIPRRTGRIWYVDATLGNDTFSGTNPAQAFATITRALSRTASGRGDVIFIYPGSYAENVVISNDYITMVGATGNGYGRPDIVPASGLALNVNAQGFKAYGMRFAAPAADTDTVRVQGNGFIFDWCVFDGDATQGDAKGLVRLKGNATDDGKTSSEGFITNSLFRGSGGIGLIFDTGDAPTNGVGSTDDFILNNRFYANDQSDIATADTGTGTYSVQVTNIYNNMFETKNKTNYIDLTTSNGGAASAQTGAIDGNYFAADAINTTRIAMVGTGFTFTGNYNTVGVVDGSALD